MDKEERKWTYGVDKACEEVGLPSKRLKTLVKIRFASKVVMFQETTEYASTINLCY